MLGLKTNEKAAIRDRDNKLYLTADVACNYLSLPSMTASGTKILIYGQETSYTIVVRHNHKMLNIYLWFDDGHKHI